MGFSERLRELRKGKQYSQSELASLVSVSVNAIANYENGLNYPKFPVMIDLMDALDCDANYFYQDYIALDHTKEMSEEENQIIEKFRKLNKHGKHAVKVILDAEYQCAAEWLNSGNLKDIMMYTPVMKSKGYVLASKPKHIKIVPTSVNEQAEFCVKMVSNMAKPMFRLGDVLLFRKEPVPHNEIGLFQVNGKIHIKKLFHVENEIMLMPFNTSMEPVAVSDSDKYEVLGKFIGKLEQNYIE